MLQFLSKSIPEESKAVRSLFEYATVGKNSWRCTAAAGAVALSILNTLGYAIEVPFKVVLSTGRCIVWLFGADVASTDFKSSFKGISDSFIFAVCMTGRIFASFIYSLEFSFAETALESTINKGFKDLETKHIVVRDEENVFVLSVEKKIPLAVNLITQENLCEFLKENPKFILVKTPDKQSYLLKRSNPFVRALVRDGYAKAFAQSSLRQEQPQPQPEAVDWPPAEEEGISDTLQQSVRTDVQPSICQQPPHLQAVDWPPAEEGIPDTLLIHPTSTATVSTQSNLQQSTISRAPKPAAPESLLDSFVLYASRHHSKDAFTKSFVMVDDLSQSFIAQSTPTAILQQAAETAACVAAIGAQMLVTYIKGQDHPLKLCKYTTVVKQIQDTFKTIPCPITNRITPLQQKCGDIADFAWDPGLYGKDDRERYHKLVVALQENVPVSAEKDTKCKPWFNRICYQRFAQTKLYNYSLFIIEKLSGPFADDDVERLTLANFWKTLEARNVQIEKHCCEAHGITGAVRAKQKLEGHFNVFFNELNNVPYVYGTMKMGGKDITILRHGVPVTQSNPLHLGTLVNKIDWFGLVPDSYKGKPIVTADYHAFIEEATDREENILHFIFENGKVKTKGGDESERVKVRLALGDQHANFFPVALPMDGHFFEGERHIVVSHKERKWINYAGQGMPELKEEIKTGFLGELDKTGFCFPQKVQAKMQEVGKTSEKYIETVINSVAAIYFQGRNVASQGEYQAFLLLTYAHLAHALCKDLDISILEAFCKNDKDRGGAFKAILTLDYLYRSNQLTPEKLQEVMVNIIAAPLMITKDAILHSRAILIKHVLDVMQKAPTYDALDEQYRIEGGQFEVAREPYQVVLPEVQL